MFLATADGFPARVPVTRLVLYGRLLGVLVFTDGEPTDVYGFP